MDIWEILEDLNSLTDVSDPDCFHPNLYHAVQTVEMIRKDGHPEWMQLIGLLHNVRKIMYKKKWRFERTMSNGRRIYEGLKEWAEVENIILPEFLKEKTQRC